MVMFYVEELSGRLDQSYCNLGWGNLLGYNLGRRLGLNLRKRSSLLRVRFPNNSFHIIIHTVYPG